MSADVASLITLYSATPVQAGTGVLDAARTGGRSEVQLGGRMPRSLRRKHRRSNPLGSLVIGAADSRGLVAVTTTASVLTLL